MAVVAESVTVATTATLLSGTTDDSAFGSSLLVKVPAGGQTVFLGGSGVTSATGFPLAAGESFASDVSPGDQVFAVVAATTQAVNVLRVGV